MPTVFTINLLIMVTIGLFFKLVSKRSAIMINTNGQASFKNTNIVKCPNLQGITDSNVKIYI